MNAWFGNISVTLKLALGFGLVLLLTMALALVGWTSLGSVVQRSERMADVNGLTHTLTDLRVARLQYLIANGGDEEGKEVERQIQALSQRQQDMLPRFRNAENQRLINQQIELMKQYQQAFDKTQAAYVTSRQTRTAMVELADRASELIDRVREEVGRSAAGSETGFVRYQAIARTEDDVQTLRYNVLTYTSDVSARTEQALNQQIERVGQGLNLLTSVFTGEYRDEVQQLQNTLNDYRSLLNTYRAVTEQRVQMREAMTEQAREIVKGSDALLEMQATLRDRDTTFANQMMIGATLLALLVGILSAWLITRQITRPLQETLEAVERIAGGDLSHSLQVNRRDELGVLQQGIQRMGSTLRDLIGGIRDGVTQIASAAEQLSAVTEQTSAGVNSQKVETDQVATAMQEMSATVQEVARSAAEASQAAVDADREAGQGDRVVGETIAQIERLAVEVSRSSDAMGELQSESNKIGGVMDVIKAVAEQTNLLALNAAIEAARAGEAGRGFAVVADEVRGLAQRTQKSTEEIEVLIAGLQRGTQQVASIMQSSRELTDSSVALTRRAGDALGAITSKVSNIQAMNQQIAAAAEQQGAVAEEISRSVVNVRDISEQTAEASEETAASSVELARLGNQLQTMVSHFRV
ncbi:HAMP domain-containing protein [Pseudomonas argentinensis]|uniref:Methyl-accepting chemotaxis protein n=1 Tax=Phytopseudomonas argentinensis TaxID=289370 RepID=A0A1I3GJ73_9GAMM|nr:methyl-accepting chemotaxis protein [Pseudomonas argentinensis]KAB0549112.1 HAMP domain-containing protein [Pseudomonas argentinensis]SFI23282.1 methyl-accepting chemotaxis protein [Pseudomonas argentinensis]